MPRQMPCLGYRVAAMECCLPHQRPHLLLDGRVKPVEHNLRGHGCIAHPAPVRSMQPTSAVEEEEGDRKGRSTGARLGAEEVQASNSVQGRAGVGRCPSLGRRTRARAAAQRAAQRVRRVRGHAYLKGSRAASAMSSGRIMFSGKTLAAQYKGEPGWVGAGRQALRGHGRPGGQGSKERMPVQNGQRTAAACEAELLLFIDMWQPAPRHARPPHHPGRLAHPRVCPPA
jgi:hypothetical protein